MVVQQRQGIPLPGVLDHAVWYQDRLYLFHSEQTKVLFCLDPEHFVGL